MIMNSIPGGGLYEALTVAPLRIHIYYNYYLQANTNHTARPIQKRASAGGDCM
jgi:hypothetical protein